MKILILAAKKFAKFIFRFFSIVNFCKIKSQESLHFPPNQAVSTGHCPCL